MTKEEYALLPTCLIGRIEEKKPWFVIKLDDKFECSEQTFLAETKNKLNEKGFNIGDFVLFEHEWSGSGEFKIKVKKQRIKIIKDYMQKYIPDMVEHILGHKHSNLDEIEQLINELCSLDNKIEQKQKELNDIEKKAEKVEEKKNEFEKKINELEKKKNTLKDTVNELEQKEKELKENIKKLGDTKEKYERNLENFIDDPNNILKNYREPYKVENIKNLSFSFAFKQDDFTKNLLFASIMTAFFERQLLILAGPTGIGKTHFIEDISHKLGWHSEVIPVRPAWTDPSDLLGYKKPLDNEFYKTRFSNLLGIAAMEKFIERGGGLLIFFDEINIAKIENYAADILSQYEKNGFIELHNDENLYENQNDPKKKVPKKISLAGRNILLGGTMNIDHTTFDLSPKVLDRSIVLKFDPPTFDDFKKFKNEIDNQSKYYKTGDIYDLFRAKKEEGEKKANAWLKKLKRKGDILDEFLKTFSLHFSWRMYNTLVSIYSSLLIKELKEEKLNDYAGSILFLTKILPRIKYSIPLGEKFEEKKNEFRKIKKIVPSISKTLENLEKQHDDKEFVSYLAL